MHTNHWMVNFVSIFITKLELVSLSSNLHEDLFSKLCQFVLYLLPTKYRG